MSIQLLRRLCILKPPLLERIQSHFRVQYFGHHYFVHKQSPLFILNSNNPTYTQMKHYAKGKDKKKSDKGKSHKVEINEQVMSEVIDVEKLKNEMELALKKMKSEYAQNLSLRTNTAAIENLKIKFEGKTYLLMELAQIIRKSPKIVVINMSSFPQFVPAALKALSTSGMNLNPQQDGNTIFVPVPVVTKELRQNLSKSAKSLFIQCKNNLRDVQTKFVKQIKNKTKEGLSDDMVHEISDQVVYIADSHIKKAEEIMVSKITELLEEAV